MENNLIRTIASAESPDVNLQMEDNDTTQLRVLCYNTHLMQFSFIEEATDAKRFGGICEYVVFQDEARRDLIIRNVIELLPDIICFQEVWSLKTMEYLINALGDHYPHRTMGDYSTTVVFGPATSGLALFSKFPLSDRTFKKFPGMTGSDALSNKGVLGATVTMPEGKKLRVFTAHTSGTLSDIRVIAEESLPRTGLQNDTPTIMLGDFNISWKSTAPNPEYKDMKKIFMFPGTGLKAASDSWIERYGEGLEPDPYTVKMRENTLHQLFSPARDTEPDTRLDYLWIRSGTVDGWVATSASVLHGPKWTYTSRVWHWAHANRTDGMPSAAELNDRLLVVAREPWGRVTCSIFDKNTSEWRHIYSGFNSSASPGIVAFQGKFHIFYRDPGGNAIFHRSSTDGEHWSDWENIGIDTGGSVCPVVYQENLYLLFVDPDGIGGMVFCTIKLTRGEEFGPGNWSVRIGTGITTRWDISAAVVVDTLVVVSKDNGPPEKSSGVMCSFLMPGQINWAPFHPEGLETSGSPGVVSIDNKVHVYYRHNEGDAIYHAFYDGISKWTINENTLHDRARGAVCPVFSNNKLWLFYSYLDEGKGGGYYQDTTLLHTQMPEVQVDLSDHYPLLVTLEPISIAINVMVRIRSTGDVIFRDGVWAGTRGQMDPIDGFKLTSETPGIKLSYMAHIQDVGDTDWKGDNEYIGVTGQSKRIEGFAIRLEGNNASSYELSYRAHIQNRGDTDFCAAGQFCGTRGEKLAVEAIFLKLTKK